MVVIAESITGVSPLGAPLLEEVDVGVLQGDGAGSFQLAGTAWTGNREVEKKGGKITGEHGGRDKRGALGMPYKINRQKLFLLISLHPIDQQGSSWCGSLEWLSGRYARQGNPLGFGETSGSSFALCIWYSIPSIHISGSGANGCKR